LKCLGIDTSGDIFSLCLREDERLLMEVRKNRSAEPGVRDAHFFAEARELIDRLGTEPLTAVAVSVGPGMFTSLRVGISLAKALSLAWSVPVVGVNTLDIIGQSPVFAGTRVLAVINAFQDDLYAALYDHRRRRSDYLAVPARALMQKFPGRLSVAGPAAALLKKARRRGGGKWTFIEDEALWPSASRVVQTAGQRIRRNDYDDADRLEPFYVKKTDAERNRA
jgi:tRNA threonylcarbamoyladenosine biosynthesis protein TsaB